MWCSESSCFFPALSLNPSEERGWEKKRQRATEDGSLAVSLRGPYEISSHVLHHAHYILICFCPALFVSFPFSHIRLLEMMAKSALFLITLNPTIRKKNDKQKTKTRKQTHVCFITYYQVKKLVFLLFLFLVIIYFSLCASSMKITQYK